MLYLTDPDPRGSMGLGGKSVYGLGSLGDFLTAIDYRTGKVAWRHRFPGGGGGGLLTTAGGLVFSGDGSGNFAAFDAANGKPLWHSRINNISNAPQTYLGRRTSAVLVAVGDTLYAFSAAPIGDSTMRYTRRDFGKLALTAIRRSRSRSHLSPRWRRRRPNRIRRSTASTSARSPTAIAACPIRARTRSCATWSIPASAASNSWVGRSRRSPVRRRQRGSRGGGRGGPPPTPEQQAAQREAAERLKRVANVGVDGPFQGAAQDVQRCRRDDLRVEAAQPEHVGRRDGIRVQRRGSPRLHAHDARTARRTRPAAAHRRNSRRRRRSTRRITRTCRAA